MENVQLAYGLGFALGHISTFLDEEHLSRVFNYIDQSCYEFANGLGDGLGHNFGYLNPDLQEKTVRWAERNNAFAIGLGIGLGHAFKYPR